MTGEPRPELQRDAERSRGDLLVVATEVFAESGYSGARVDEIAERTRTTKRMIYYYFGNKEGLYMAVLETAYRGIREAEQRRGYRRPAQRLVRDRGACRGRRGWACQQVPR